ATLRAWQEGKRLPCYHQNPSHFGTRPVVGPGVAFSPPRSGPGGEATGTGLATARRHTMAIASGLFEMEDIGQTLIVTPRQNLRELDWPQIDAGMADVLDRLGEGAVRNVVLDFHRTDYYGSTALGYFLKLWKRVREHKGRMAFCPPSRPAGGTLQGPRPGPRWAAGAA